MIWKYTLAVVLISGFLIFLKNVQDSPVRSWKSVLFWAFPLCLCVCLWLKWAYPPPPTPQPRASRIELNRAELQRNYSRMEGVDKAVIVSNRVEINFKVPKSLDALKSFARSAAGTAGHFLQVEKMQHVTVVLSVQGRLRYQLDYSPPGRVLNEETF